MNGFEMMAESYRKSVKEGYISQEDADKEIRILEFLATCDQEDLCRMVDSSAFNDIIRAFFELALNNADLKDEQRTDVMNQLRWLFSEKKAKEILDIYMQ